MLTGNDKGIHKSTDISVKQCFYYGVYFMPQKRDTDALPSNERRDMLYPAFVRK
jgi:hypothetical protein